MSQDSTQNTTTLDTARSLESDSDLLSSQLSLPCGAVLNNRIAKAAMTEGLADAEGHPTDELLRLYEIWSKGGAGLLISGNIQVDKDHLERPGNVCIEGKANDQLHDRLSQWTKAATSNKNHFWAQISYASRQTPKTVNSQPKAPSAIKLEVPGGLFAEPIALELDEIKELVQRFANTASVCKETGFTGVQIHAAHGYLISTFLSPKSNKRTDNYGGSLENRARFLLEVVAATRALVGADFPIAVKMNSADFQRGGFAFEDSLKVASWLSDAGIDLLEISGGNYEQPKLLGLTGKEKAEDQNVAPSTAAREAYFVDFAMQMQKQVSIPLMVTGGFRSRSAMDYALESGAADVIGIGRPFCSTPNCANDLLNGLQQLPTYEKELALIPNWLGFLKRIQMLKTLDGFAVLYWFYGQIYSLARTGKIDLDLTPLQGVKEYERMNKKLLGERSNQP